MTTQELLKKHHIAIELAIRELNDHVWEGSSVPQGVMDYLNVVDQSLHTSLYSIQLTLSSENA